MSDTPNDVIMYGFDPSDSTSVFSGNPHSAFLDWAPQNLLQIRASDDVLLYQIDREGVHWWNTERYANETDALREALNRLTFSHFSPEVRDRLLEKFPGGSQ